MAKSTNEVIATPVILDLGKVPKKRLKQLREGRGALLAELRTAIDEVVAELGTDVADKAILPVVVIYGQKKKKRKKVKLISLL